LIFDEIASMMGITGGRKKQKLKSRLQDLVRAGVMIKGQSASGDTYTLDPKRILRM